jgi:PTS system ascorbate-specific IIA component
MPHARTEDGVLKDCFSLLVLKNFVKFPKDEKKIRILLAFGATSADIHVSSALPQIVALFDQQKTIEEILQSKNKNDVIDIIKKIF